MKKLRAIALDMVETVFSLDPLAAKLARRPTGPFLAAIVALVAYLMLVAVLAAWRFSQGSVAVDHIATPNVGRSAISSPTARAFLKRLHPHPAARREGRRPTHQAALLGGLDLSRISSPVLIAAFIPGCVLFLLQRAGAHRRH